MNIKAELRQITSGDESIFPDALELLNRTQGRDLFARNYLSQKTSSADAAVFGAFVDDEIQAVAVAEFIDNFDWYLPFDSTINQYNGTTAGPFSTLCVSENLQGDKGSYVFFSRDESQNPFSCPDCSAILYRLNLN